MRSVFLTAALALTLLLVACGGSPTPASANGSWSAALITSAVQHPQTFAFSLTQNNVTLVANRLNFSGSDNVSQCFGPGTAMSGSLSSTKGGPMTLTMSWTPPGGTTPNTLTMQGNMAAEMTSGSGTFTIAPQIQECASEMGTFTMTRAPAHSMGLIP